jgi:CHAT domain-containing protein
MSHAPFGCRSELNFAKRGLFLSFRRHSRGRAMTVRAAAFFTHLLASAGLATVLLLGGTAVSLAQQGSPAQSEAPALTPDEAAFEERIQAAWDLMQTEGRFEEGYRQLKATLAELARSDLFAMTLTKYTEAGQIFHQNNFFQEADEIFSEGEKTRAINEDVKERPGFYLAYAQFKAAVADIPASMKLFEKATNLYAQYYGKESREVLSATDVWAVMLGGIGQLGTAANLQQGVYDLALKNFGPDDALTWRFANNLAEALRGLGAPAQALELDLMLLTKRTERYGRDHFNVLVTANNTAQDYLDLGDHAGAMRNFELNRQIAAALREQDPGWEVQAQTWLLYTQLLFGKKQFDAADISELDSVITNSGYPALLSYKIAHLLAEHSAATGDAVRRMKYLEQALAIANDNMGPLHPQTFLTRRVIANAKFANDAAATATEYEALDKNMLGWLAEQVMFAGSRVVQEATRALADDMLYDYALLAEKNAAMVPAFADAARRWPSMDNGGRETIRKLMLLVDPKDDVMLGMLRRQLQISQLYYELFAVGTTEELGYQMLDEGKGLEEKINARLKEQNYDLTLLEKPLPTARELLEKDQALVTYFITRKWKADRRSEQPFEDVRLYAFVSRKDRTPTIHYLGDPREITAHQPTAQMAMLRSTRPVERGAVSIAEMGEVFSGLYGNLFAPLENDLADVATVFIIPDGQLFAVPFSLLEDDKGRLLEERYTVRLLTRPESLYGVTAEQTLPRNGNAVLAGGLDYSNGAEKGADPLPGTLQEINAIAGLLRSRNLATEALTGDQASEPTLRKDMETAAVVHLATHGSYRSARNGGVSNVDTLWQSEVILSKSGDRHLMARDETDGRLYASELMTWDLSKLDLLVLSACETGRGEETFVGGMRGLPTAINIAGARRALLTLWPVADEGTANFMTRYYGHLVGGMTYADALRQTRRDAIAGDVPGARSPLVWAAFVMFEN